MQSLKNIVVSEAMSFRTYRRFAATPLILPTLCCALAGIGLSGAVSPALAAPDVPVSSVGTTAPTAASQPKLTSARAKAAQAAADAMLKQRSYILAPGDVLRVSVPGYPDYSHDSVPVLPNGTILMPFYGTLKVNGKSVDQVQTELRKLVGKRIKQPDWLTVSVPQPRPPKEEPDPDPVFMSVLGIVKTPGRVEIKDGFRVSEVLGAVGGPANGRLDTVRAMLARAGQPQMQLDLQAISQQPDSPLNILIKPGDVITITQIDLGRLAINGDVNRPGVYQLSYTPTPAALEVSSQPRLSEVVLAAGGLKAPPAPANATPLDLAGQQFTGFVMRGPEKINLRLQDALTQRDPEADISLRPNDFVVISAVPMINVRADGLVRAPGQFQLAPGSSFRDALVRAGGLTREPDKVVASIWRAGKVLPVRLEDALKTSDPRLNLPLEENDVLQLQEPETIQVQVAGGVAKAQPVILPVGAKLLDALGAAGGLSIKPEQARIGILRKQTDGKLLNLDIDPVALRDLKPEQNVVLQTGDFINVDEVKPQIKRVSVSGQVAKPGTVEYQDKEISLTELIVGAGGPLPAAALSRVVIQRGDKTLTVDAYEALRFGKPLNFTMQDGDFVVLQPLTDRVTVMEAVNRPGDVPIPEKGTLTLLEALTAAGGRQPNARDIVLIRPRPANMPPGDPQVTVVRPDPAKGQNIQEMQQQLQNGDVIYVYPGKVTQDKVGSILRYLTPLGILGRLF